jgi:hypothetical protein
MLRTCCWVSGLTAAASFMTSCGPWHVVEGWRLRSAVVMRVTDAVRMLLGGVADSNGGLYEKLRSMTCGQGLALEVSSTGTQVCD